MDELGLNLPVLIAQLVNFFLLLVLLRIFLYKPILEMLDRRAQRIREGVE
ncbi:MAG: ATP F0F1 synthase subunit B, partial [Chloroflexi bacterium]|nr:ATP F0F1 synthase subunit B [Chloroflexota bacterium]